MIFSAPIIREDELQAIAKIDEIRRSLGYALQSPGRWTGVLRRNLIAGAIQGSNSIEGYTVSLEDAIAVVEEEEVAAPVETLQAVQGYRAALTYIIGLAEDPHFRFNEELARSLHYMMISYDAAKNPGRWRPGPIYVRRDATGEVVYEGPPAEFVPALMRELVDSVQDENDVPVTVRAAMAHLNLVMIHPFSDGNGRMARAVQTLILARDGIVSPPFSSIEEYLGAGRNTESYYRVLAEVGGGRWSPERDTRQWLHFCLRAHLQQAVTVQRRTRETQRLWDELEIELRKEKLPERAIFALHDAAMGLKVRSPRYRSNAEVSMQLASRDLKALVSAGLLVAHGEKKGRWYVASDRLMTIRSRAREPKRSAAEMFKNELDLPLE